MNEAFARSVGGRSVIGQRVALRPAGSPQAKPVVREIVGIARQVQGRPDEAKDFVQVYVPMAQDLSDDIFLVVRPKSGRAEALAPSVRAAISRVDKEQLVSIRNIMTLEDIAWTATGRHRLRAVMAVAFAALALVLAMVGVFGIREAGRYVIGLFITSAVMRLPGFSRVRAVGHARRAEDTHGAGEHGVDALPSLVE